VAATPVRVHFDELEAAQDEFEDAVAEYAKACR
jgi:hypothetical protein